MNNTTQTILPGYKQTEVGVIPEEWNVIEIGKLCKYQNGSSLEKYFGGEDGYKVISIGNYSTSGKYIENNSYINRNNEKYIKKYILNKNDLTMILNDKTSTGDIIGKVLLIEDDNKYVFNQRTMRLVAHEEIYPDYLYSLINSDFVHNKLAKLAKPGTQIYFNTSDVLSFKVGFPKDKKEQYVISIVLLEMNLLIQNLEKLIAKKKAIKQGTMQELLSGKSRLPGFSGEWYEKELGKICEIKKGQLITESLRKEGSIPVIAGGKTPAYYHNKANRLNGAITISASGANAGYVAFFDYPIFASDCSTIEDGNDYSLKYIYYYLLLNQDKIYKMQTGGAQPHIHPRDLFPLKIKIPEKKEQIEIAVILTDMDREIETLEQKLKKYKQIKQGAMQVLLTGKVRLVKN